MSLIEDIPALGPAWNAISDALHCQPDETLVEAAERCLSDGVGQQDIARAILDLDRSGLQGMDSLIALARLGERCLKEGAR